VCVEKVADANNVPETVRRRGAGPVKIGKLLVDAIRQHRVVLNVLLVVAVVAVRTLGHDPRAQLANGLANRRSQRPS